MRHLTPGQAAQGPFCPLEAGTAWGHTWEYMWCRADITLPEAAADKTVAMEPVSYTHLDVYKRQGSGFISGEAISGWLT